MNRETWLPWLRDGTRPGRRSAYPLPPANSRPAVALLEDPRLRASTTSTEELAVDRAMLVALAGDATSADPAALIRLFVATMMWGSGTTYGRGPRRTAEALSADNLADVLLETRDAVHTDDLVSAHRAFSVQGVGESFFTKWFWTASLDREDQRRPLILDNRVRAVLHRILGSHPSWKVHRGGAGYDAYVAVIHDAADALSPTFPHIDAEKIEWLMFDRSDHKHVAEVCLDGAVGTSG